MHEKIQKRAVAELKEKESITRDRAGLRETADISTCNKRWPFPQELEGGAGLGWG